MKIIATPEEIKGLIFDIDQTLYDNLEYYNGQKNLLLDKLASIKGKPFDIMLQEIEKRQTDYASQNDGRELSLGNLFLRFGISIEQSCAWRSELFEPEKYLSKDKKLISTMKALSKKYKIGSVTNTSTDIAERTLKVLGVERFFTTIIGLDRTHESKPALKPFVLASKELQMPFKHLISIGDRLEIDIELPVQYGMGGILVQGMEDVYNLEEVLAHLM